jgi:hypothetical protein
LFWIIDDKEFAGNRPHPTPVVHESLRPAASGSPPICILKLIYEYVSKPLLQFRLMSWLSYEVPRAQQQVKKIKVACPLLQSFERFNNRPKLFAQARRKICAGALEETSHTFLQRIASSDQFSLGKHILREVSNEVLGSPAPQKAKQPRFNPIVVPTRYFLVRVSSPT